MWQCVHACGRWNEALQNNNVRRYSSNLNTPAADHETKINHSQTLLIAPHAPKLSSARPAHQSAPVGWVWLGPPRSVRAARAIARSEVSNFLRKLARWSVIYNRITLVFIMPTRLRSVIGSVNSVLMCSSTP